ncbi:MAG: protein kinase, partial [Anaerolineales bacterium]|nr:protein kinase [Anaerolineales bacterium]
SLATYLRDLHENGARLSLEQITHLLKSLSSGVDYAHAQGIIHRDIKPANIILHNKSGEYSPTAPLPKDTEPIITDFGLVRITNSTTKTISGVVSGTPAYMSPEQAQGMAVDHRSDIYSLSIVLYEMLAGRPPFEGDSTLGIILKHISEPPPPIENIAPEIQSVIDKALSKNPANRYQSARELFEGFYRAIGKNAESATVHSLHIRTPVPATVSSQPVPRRNNFLWIGIGVFVCLCLGFITTSVLGVSVYTLFPRLQAATPTEDHSHEATPSITEISPVEGSAETSNYVGTLRFQGNLDQISISATLPEPQAGTQYEAWLIENSGESHISLGILADNGTGQFTLTYFDPENRNLLEAYNSMEITSEANPDASPNSSGTVLYSSRVPQGALTHIRHLIVKFEEGVGLTTGLVNTSALVQESASAMEDAYENGNSKTVRTSAEAIVNLIVGSQSKQYDDWDNNGNINDPGNGFGLLLNGNSPGYIGGTISHTEYSTDSSDATTEIKLHGGHVIVCAKNIEEWAIELQEIAIRIAQADSGENAEADIRLAVALANQIHDGLDIDGNESIDPIPGEGGALTAFAHAEYMSDMLIMQGEDQLPPPAE